MPPGGYIDIRQTCACLLDSSSQDLLTYLVSIVLSTRMLAQYTRLTVVVNAFLTLGTAE
jgi:hypothetical protein